MPQELIQHGVGFCGEGKTGDCRQKPHGARREPNMSGNQTLATLVGGKSSRLCAIPAP